MLSLYTLCDQINTVKWNTRAKKKKKKKNRGVTNSSNYCSIQPLRNTFRKITMSQVHKNDSRENK